MTSLEQKLANAQSRVEERLRRDIVAWAVQQPGFVNGQWMRTADGSAGIGVVTFDSEEAAMTAAKGPRNFPHDEKRAWNIEDVDVLTQLASA